VDPFEPAQNIEGGVRYFSYLLKMFGGVELALVAHNGGPGFAGAMPVAKRPCMARRAIT
jgi:soluble lytic murein transglycosylase-like protein